MRLQCGLWREEREERNEECGERKEERGMRSVERGKRREETTSLRSFTFQNDFYKDIFKYNYDLFERGVL